ncbi:MAG: PAS domain S-box protein [Nitrospirota bacterium]
MTERLPEDLVRLKGLNAVYQALATAQGHEFSLQRFLEHIVETGTKLTGARYGALGVFDEAGEQLIQFITVGLDEATRRKIGALPTGRGLLGYLAKEGSVLRLKDLTRHQSSVGFPPHHPPMKSFLGVSIRAHGRLFGRLYLTEKQVAAEFTEIDAEVITALAVQAGTAIENLSLIEKLRAAEAKHRALLESTGEGIFGLDLDGRCTFINQAGAAMLGYTPNELMGQDMHARIHHTRADGSPYLEKDCPILRAFRTGQGCRLDHELLWRRDGSSFPAEFSSYPLREAGRIIGAVVTFTDITKRKQSQDKLRESEEKFRAVAETALDAIVSAESRGYVTYFNKGAERIFGYSSDEVIGHSVTLLMPERFREAHRHGLERFLLMGEAHIIGKTVELAGTRKDGTEFPLELSLSFWKAAGQTFFTAIIHDITERKRLEEQFRQSQKMEAVGQLAGGVAHDFNNLLTVINGYSELMLHTLPVDDPQRNRLEQIKTAGKRAALLTQQILAFSRRQILEPKVLDLNEMVANMDTLLRRLIGEDITLASFQDSALGRVKADPGQIEQIIMNLAVNARDAMPQGGRLTIETANVELDQAYARSHASVHPGPYVMLAVSDTGIGMDAKTQARLFEPFFTTKEPGKGTGLGLATVYGIVKQSGGNIWVYSEPGKGATFKIYLPRVEKEAEAMAPPPVRPETLRGSETILLVEDDAMVRTLARAVLQYNDYTVLEAKHGTEALRISQEHSGPIHLLLTDVVMPGMSGRDSAARLAPLRPDMKILYMSGYTGNASAHHGVLDTGIAFLQKPFTPTALVQKVRETLDTPPPRDTAQTGG